MPEEVKPPFDPLRAAFIRCRYLKACQDGIFVDPKGFAMCDKGVTPSMDRIMELHAFAQELGQHECDSIAMSIRLQQQRRMNHAARRLAFIALGVSIVSMLISLSPIL